MKICICSDSHGFSDEISKMLALEKPQALIFLGDGERDLQKVFLPETLLLAAVRGNCDFGSLLPDKRVLTIEGKKIFMTHGHNYNVKNGTDRLLDAAKSESCDIALYGHTHIANAEIKQGVLLLCPGSIGYQTARYIVMDIQNGDIKYRTQRGD